MKGFMEGIFSIALVLAVGFVIMNIFKPGFSQMATSEVKSMIDSIGKIGSPSSAINPANLGMLKAMFLG